MRRRDFLGTLGVGAAGLAVGGSGCASNGSRGARGKPWNIVFILMDDMGWADLGCYGSTFYETPNIDRLAAEGVRFTDAYAACPVCSPTRASIITGKYPARLGLTNYLKGVRSPKDSPVLTAPYADELEPEEITIAEALKTAGYTTCHIGKWHLGSKAPCLPEAQGFDVDIGGSTGSGGTRSFFWPGWEKFVPIQGAFEGEYLTDRLSDEACKFVETHATNTFLLDLCHFAPHIPLDAKEDKVAKYRAKLAAHPPAPGGQENPDYAAMIQSVDEGVGRLLDTLKRCGIEDRTIVVFFSDNGGLSVVEGPKTPATSNAPFRDGKGYLHEGGIRVPCIIRWPGVVKPGSVCHTPICSIDFFPTWCELAGVDLNSLPTRKPIDGISIMPLLKDPNATLKRQALYWHYPHFANQGGRPGGAIRVGDWKLIESYETGALELYDLKNDLSETKDLADAMPKKTRRLHQMLIDWRRTVNANMPPPNPEYQKDAPKPSA